MTMRRSVQEIQARRIAGNRARKIVAYFMSGASLPAMLAMWWIGSTAFEQIVTGLSFMAIAELLDINIALRGGE